MVKKVAEYSIMEHYENTTLALIDAKTLLESFHDKGLWPRFVAYMDVVAAESHVNSGTVNVNEDDCKSFHFMCVNSDVDTSGYKTWFNVQTVSGWYHSHGNILVDSGYIMCIPYDDIKDHIYGSGLNFVTIHLENADCGMSYKTNSMFDDYSSSRIKVCDASKKVLYEVNCSEIMHTGSDWEKIYAGK